MLDPDEIRWVKSTANELNNLLQIIRDSSQVLENLGQGSEEFVRYSAILRNGIERAAKVTGLMVDRVGGIAGETVLSEVPPSTDATAAAPDASAG
jgi:hypothetical protein